MTGLDKIIEEIRQEATTASEKELARTKKEVEQILADGLQEREKYKTAYLAQTTSQVELLLNRGEASAALQKRKLMLKEKQEIIQQMLEQAKETLLNLPKDEYFGLLIKMLNRYPKVEQCKLLLSERDLERITDNFIQELENRDIALEKDSCKIDGGFVLVYGDIEENCSFGALFSAYKEILQDKISALIFTNSEEEMER